MSITEEKINTKVLIILMALAYIFSVAIRFIWIYQFNGQEAFYWNNELMINTNDGYYFATAAKELLFGSNSYNPRLAGALNDYPIIIYLTYILAKLTPLSLDTIILYMPTFISSLLVIPVILTMRLFSQSFLGFFSALLASVALSYYNRTMTGYYDSDMFSVLMQTMVLYAFLRIAVKKDIASLVFAAILVAIYPLAYPQGLAIVYAMYVLLGLFLIFDSKTDSFTYKSIIMLSVCVVMIPFYLKILLIFAMFFAEKKLDLKLKSWTILAAFAFIYSIIGANITNLIMSKILGYVSRGTEQSGLKFLQVIQTVKEASAIPFFPIDDSKSNISERVIGSSLGFVISMLGYILLVVRKKEFIIALPLIAIAIFAHWGGLRFTVYAVSIAAISALYCVYWAALKIEKLINFSKAVYFLVPFATILLLYPNITHIISYKVPTVFNKEEVKVLDDFKKHSSSKDYTITWWDYGYPVWYYSNTNTIIDGGKHNQDNFIVSQISRTTSQKQAANLAKLSVDTYVKSDYKTIVNELFKNKNPEELLEKLETENLVNIPSDRDVFIYFPLKMLNIFPTIMRFSSINLNTGEEYHRFFYNGFLGSQEGQILNIQSYWQGSMQVDLSRGIVKIGNNSVPISKFAVTSYQQDGSLKKEVQQMHQNADHSLVFMKDYGYFLFMDNGVYDSIFIKLFVLEEYDSSLFEPVVLSPWGKIYKVKK